MSGTYIPALPDGWRAEVSLVGPGGDLLIVSGEYADEGYAFAGKISHREVLSGSNETINGSLKEAVTLARQVAAAAKRVADAQADQARMLTGVLAESEGAAKTDDFGLPVDEPAVDRVTPDGTPEA